MWHPRHDFFKVRSFSNERSAAVCCSTRDACIVLIMHPPRDRMLCTKRAYQPPAESWRKTLQARAYALIGPRLHPHTVWGDVKPERGAEFELVACLATRHRVAATRGVAFAI
ncbi:hypothetical protein EVAR_55994_1 [Eumeta japonica]|uniref:Uncharacterized protein n=1 Tax=Eumeta variegata TaxID=151549 RepID=A0A4C1Z0J9_EUMVA|nr:hypothetical protein EVAR_55994_1 [Eumeta japonica]